MDNKIITLFQLLKAGVTGKKPALDILKLDFEFIYKISLINRVAIIIYYALLLYPKEEREQVHNFDKFQYIASMDSIKHYKQEFYFNEIAQAFEENNINLTIFKGQDIQNLYPKQEMRVKGDIDFVVEKKDTKKAYEVLKEIGFRSIAHSKEEVAMEKDGVIIELHNYLFGHEYKEINYRENQHKLKENIYILNNEYSFVFNIDHLCKHVLYGGASLKYLIDIYLFLFHKQLNILKMKEMFIEKNLLIFANYVILACCKLFDMNDEYHDFFDKDFNYQDEVMENFINYLTFGGEFGVKHNSLSIRSITKSRIKLLMEKIFAPIEIVYQRPKIAWYKYLLYPFYYIKYIIRMFNKNNFKKLKSYSSNKESKIKKLFIDLKISNND